MQNEVKGKIHYVDTGYNEAGMLNTKNIKQNKSNNFKNWLNNSLNHEYFSLPLVQ